MYKDDCTCTCTCRFTLHIQYVTFQPDVLQVLERCETRHHLRVFATNQDALGALTRKPMLANAFVSLFVLTHLVVFRS